MKHVCGRSYGGGYYSDWAMEHYVGTEIVKDACGLPARHTIELRGGNLPLCAEHYDEYMAFDVTV